MRGIIREGGDDNGDDGDDGEAAAAAAAADIEMDDPRATRRQLAADLALPAAQQTFLDSLAEAIASDGLLRRCLLPINVSVAVRCALCVRGIAWLQQQHTHARNTASTARVRLLATHNTHTHR